MTPKRVISIVLLLTALPPLFVPNHRESTVRFVSIREIAPLDDNNFVTVKGVNNKGWVVGYSAQSVPPHGSIRHKPWIWRDGKIMELWMPNGEETHACAINNRGDIGGDNWDGKQYAPLLWSYGDYANPRRIAGGPGAVASLNDEGVIVGRTAGGHPYRACVWKDGKRTVLESGMVDARSEANCINQEGEIVGENLIQIEAAISGGAFFGPTRALLWKNNSPHELPALGGRDAVAKSINNDGVVVGKANLNKSLWRACMWKNGRADDLGGLGGERSEASAINNQGLIVGRSQKPDGNWSPCLWTDGKYIDLQSVLPPDSNWTLYSADGINDRGQVVGIGELKDPDKQKAENVLRRKLYSGFVLTLSTTRQ